MSTSSVRHVAVFELKHKLGSLAICAKQGLNKDECWGVRRSFRDDIRVSNRTIVSPWRCLLNKQLNSECPVSS